jgi:hypothetical protein
MRRSWIVLSACLACSSAEEPEVVVESYGGPGAFGSNAAAGAAGGAAVGAANTAGNAAGSTAGPGLTGNAPGGVPEQGVVPIGLTGAAGTAASVGSGAAGSAATGNGAAGAGAMAGAAGNGAAGNGAAGASMGAAGAPTQPGTGGTGAQPAPEEADSCPANALFCDDFEDDALGQFPGAPWQNQTGSGATAQVDGVQSFSGSKAVHVSAPAGQAYRRGYFSLQQGSSNIFPAASDEMFGRAMFFLDATPNAVVHWTLIQAEGRAADGGHDAYYRYGGQQQGGAGLMANYETNNGVSTDCYAHSATRMPVQRWACVEWHFRVATNEMQMYLDGNEVTDMHVTNRPTSAGSGCLGNGVNGQWLAPPAFTTLHLGFERYQQPTNAQNLWVDDVVVSTERVGCPAP